MYKNNAILFLGDVILFKPVKFKDNHTTVINLECPIIANADPVGGKINLSVRHNYLINIFGHNLLYTCLGNNHIFDFREEGLESTFFEPEKSEIKWFGINSGPNDNIFKIIKYFLNNS